MFGIALSVAACLRSGTRADVAWLVESEGLPAGDPSDALMLTPGGGRIGTLAEGALDGQLADLAGRWSAGRLVEIELDEVDALIAGLPGPGSARCMLVPAATLPADLWEAAAGRTPLCLVLRMEGDEVAGADLYTEDGQLVAFGKSIIDMRTLEAGGYLLRVYSADGAVTEDTDFEIAVKAPLLIEYWSVFAARTPEALPV